MAEVNVSADACARLLQEHELFELLPTHGKVVTLDELSMPSMFHFKRDGSIARVPHGDIGWSDKGGKILAKWIRNNVTGYEKDLKKKKKAASESAEDELKHEEL